MEINLDDVSQRQIILPQYFAFLQIFLQIFFLCKRRKKGAPGEASCFSKEIHIRMEEKKRKRKHDGVGNDDEDDEEDNDDEEERRYLIFSAISVVYYGAGKTQYLTEVAPHKHIWCLAMCIHIGSRESDDIDLPSFLVAYFPSACVDTQINVGCKARHGASFLAARDSKKKGERWGGGISPVLFNPRAQTERYSNRWDIRLSNAICLPI